MNDPMNPAQQLEAYIKNHENGVGRIVDFCPEQDLFYKFDFTAANKEINESIYTDVTAFSSWITKKLAVHNCRFGIGGYLEKRVIYRQPRFNENTDEPRDVHLGIDIWTIAGSIIYAPLRGKIHSFNNNNDPGDYGPTIILEHDLGGMTLYSLYGHLSLNSIQNIKPGDAVTKNQAVGRLGTAEENGGWPPHLHFQLMFSMEGRIGDYPGVCCESDKVNFEENVPDPQLLLQLPKAVNA